MPQQSSLLIRNVVVVTVDTQRRLIEDGTVAIRGDRIIDVGPSDELIGRYESERTIDAQGKAILPGLVDTHVHSYLTRGIGDDLPLEPWLLDVIYPKLAQLSPEDAYLGALMTYCEAIKGGTTCVNNMWRHMSRAADAAEEIGIRATLSCLVADESERLETLEANVDLVHEKQGTAGGRVRAWIGVEWVPIIATELLPKARELANQYGVGIHIHLNESLGELEMSKKRHGKRSMELAYDVGILGPDCIAVHCVWLTRREIRMLKETGTNVSHNPVSNAKTGVGIAPIPELLAAGVNVALGHDGAASNNSRDMFEVMKWAALVHRADRVDASVTNAAQVLEMATINGARALGLEDDIGSIEKGKKADLILLDLDSPHMTPVLLGSHGNVTSNMVFAAHGEDVDTVMIDGRIVMENRKILTVDEAQLKKEVNLASRNLVGRIFKNS